MSVALLSMTAMIVNGQHTVPDHSIRVDHRCLVIQRTHIVNNKFLHYRRAESFIAPLDALGVPYDVYVYTAAKENYMWTQDFSGIVAEEPSRGNKNWRITHGVELSDILRQGPKHGRYSCFLKTPTVFYEDCGDDRRCHGPFLFDQYAEDHHNIVFTYRQEFQARMVYMGCATRTGITCSPGLSVPQDEGLLKQIMLSKEALNSDIFRGFNPHFLPLDFTSPEPAIIRPAVIDQSAVDVPYEVIAQTLDGRSVIHTLSLPGVNGAEVQEMYLNGEFSPFADDSLIVAWGIWIPWAMDGWLGGGVRRAQLLQRSWWYDTWPNHLKYPGKFADQRMDRLVDILSFKHLVDEDKNCLFVRKVLFKESGAREYGEYYPFCSDVDTTYSTTDDAAFDVDQLAAPVAFTDWRTCLPTVTTIYNDPSNTGRVNKSHVYGIELSVQPIDANASKCRVVPVSNLDIIIREDTGRPGNIRSWLSVEVNDDMWSTQYGSEATVWIPAPTNYTRVIPTTYITCNMTEWEITDPQGPCPEVCENPPIRTRERQAHAVKEEQPGQELCGPLIEEYQCPAVCPMACRLGEWSDYHPCTADCTQTRFRDILVPASNNGSCDDLQHTIKSCLPGENACSPDCRLSEWSEFGVCTDACVQSRSRFRYPAAEGGADCTGDDPLVEERECVAEGFCTRECVLGEWGDWSGCSEQCQQKRMRDVVVAPWLKTCPKSIEERQCSTGDCDVDCMVTEWTEWSVCDKRVGIEVRNRFITQPPNANGTDCPDLEMVRNCRVDCELEQDWKMASICSSSCEQEVVRDIKYEALNNGSTCETIIEREPCTSGLCQESEVEGVQSRINLQSIEDLRKEGGLIQIRALVKPLAGNMTPLSPEDRVKIAVTNAIKDHDVSFDDIVVAGYSTENRTVTEGEDAKTELYDIIFIYTVAETQNPGILALQDPPVAAGQILKTYSKGQTEGLGANMEASATTGEYVYVSQDQDDSWSPVLKYVVPVAAGLVFVVFIVFAIVGVRRHYSKKKRCMAESTTSLDGFAVRDSKAGEMSDSDMSVASRQTDLERNSIASVAPSTRSRSDSVRNSVTDTQRSSPRVSSVVKDDTYSTVASGRNRGSLRERNPVPQEMDGGCENRGEAKETGT
eukprot:Clim_evm18s209 gene=Clim_evmTU18s209